MPLKARTVNTNSIFTGGGREKGKGEEKKNLITSGCLNLHGGLSWKHFCEVNVDRNRRLSSVIFWPCLDYSKQCKVFQNSATPRGRGSRETLHFLWQIKSNVFQCRVMDETRTSSMIKKIIIIKSLRWLFQAEQINHGHVLLFKYQTAHIWIHTLT